MSLINLEETKTDDTEITNLNEAAYTSLGNNSSDDESESESEAEAETEDLNGDNLYEDFPSRSSAYTDEEYTAHDEQVRRINMEEYEDDVLRPGDHVYIWKKWGMFQKTHQLHGIVNNVDPDDPDNVTIVTFYHKDGRDREASDSKDYHDVGDGTTLTRSEKDDEWNDDSLVREGSTAKRQEQTITASVREESLYTFSHGQQVHKVKYGQTLAKRLLRRGGTVTSCDPDERGLVLARVKYLLEHTGKIPEHHIMSANGECAAVWCRMGRWCTLQGSSILHIMFVGQAGVAVAGGAVASNVFLWAPMPGFWGSVGYIWYVPATVAFPILVPVLIGFGLASLVPLEVLRRFRKKWVQISKELNADFWANTDDDVREFFYASTLSADADWMTQFFMDEVQKEEKEKGKYMPLNVGGDDKGDNHNWYSDNDDDEDEDEMVKRMSKEYGMSSVQEAKDSNPSALKENWNTMVEKMNTSFTKRNEQNIRPTPMVQKDDNVSLLAGEGKDGKEDLIDLK